MGYDKTELRRALCLYRRLGLFRVTLSPIDAAMRIRGCLRSRADAEALFAVYETLRYLRATDQEEVAEAVCAVYGDTALPAAKPLKRHEISDRVQRFAVAHHCDARTVWRRLQLFVTLYERVRAQ